MSIQVFILGFLIRKGPMHGYGLKRALAGEVADFADIKLPNIYYHLEKMEKSGAISSSRVSGGNNRARFIYAVKPEGEKLFHNYLRNILENDCYKPQFDIDSILYFYNFMDRNEIIGSFRKRKETLSRILNDLNSHMRDEINNIPDKHRHNAELLFLHHLYHYKAELQWVNRILDRE